MSLSLKRKSSGKRAKGSSASDDRLCVSYVMNLMMTKSLEDEMVRRKLMKPSERQIKEAKA